MKFNWFNAAVALLVVLLIIYLISVEATDICQ